MDDKKTQNVINAASDLLNARFSDMETMVEWVALARSLAACSTSGRKTNDFFNERDLTRIEEQKIEWDVEVDGPFPS